MLILVVTVASFVWAPARVHVALLRRLGQTLACRLFLRPRSAAARRACGGNVPKSHEARTARAPVMQAQLALASAKGAISATSGPGTALARSCQAAHATRVREPTSTGGETMRRLHIVLVILMLAVVAALRVQAQQPAHLVSTPDTLKWVEPGVLPGARLAVVQGDPGKEGPFVYRLKLPAGYKVPPHYHKASENVTVLAGSFSIGMGKEFDVKKGQEL